MAKLRAFEAANPSRPGPQCGICKLPEPLRAFLNEGRASGSTFRVLAAIVTAEGHKVTGNMVAYHLREHAKA